MMTNRTHRIACFLITTAMTLQAGISAAADWKVGDKVVTTVNAPVQIDTRTLTTVPEGTELVVTGIEDDWVAVDVERDGKEITGWIDVEHLASATMSEIVDGDTTKLWVASLNGDTEVIKMLLASKADVNVRNRFGATALMMASNKGHGEVVKLLLAAGADVNVARKMDGTTALWLASQNGQGEIVKLLLSGKADVEAADKDGVTPLMMASNKSHAEVVKLLLANKADVNAAHPDGRTPLWQASTKGHSEVVKLLLAGKADVNVAHKTHGATPLIVASGQGHAETVGLLLAAGADVNAKGHLNGKDFTALSIAKEAGYTRIVELLKKHGAKE